MQHSLRTFGQSLTQCLKQSIVRRRVHGKPRLNIDSLPDEILEYVFLLGQDANVCEYCKKLSEKPMQPRCTCAFPLERIVSSVSRRWRAIALDSSQLWTKICFTPNTSFEELRQYLRRSRARSLSILITSSVRGRPLVSGPTELAAMLSFLLEHITRWERLRIVMPYPALLSSIMSALSEDGVRAPLLKSLDVECPFEAGFICGSGSTYPRPFPGGAPRLQHVTLHRCCFPLSPEHPFPELHSFSVASSPWTLSDLNTLATTSPLLTDLTIVSSYKLEAHVPLHFPALRSLRVGDYFQNDTILTLLHAPELEVLQIEDMDVQFNTTVNWYVDALRGTGEDMSRGKFPKLRSLSLQMPGSPEDPSLLLAGLQLGQLLSLFPSITHLAFSGLHLEGFVKTFAALHYGPSAPNVLLPNLTQLTLEEGSEARTLYGLRGLWLFESIVELVIIRQAARCPLEKVYLPAVILARDRFLLRKKIILLRTRASRCIHLQLHDADSS